MSIMDTLWPWKALRELRRENRNYLIHIADDMTLIESLRSDVRRIDSVASAYCERVARQKDEIMRLREELKAAPYRDPKTGRMAKRPKE